MVKKIHIMVIDDENIVVTRLKASLEKYGYVVKVFTHSEQALQELSRHHFDMIVTDLKMPGVDGMEIFRYAHTHFPEIKIIIISGFATVETAKEAFKKGVYDFFVKPFRISQLRDIVNKAVEELQNKG